jgi:hypothetical protein
LIKLRLNIILLAVVLALGSCAKKKEIEKPVKLQNKSPKYLVNKLSANQQNFEYFFAKYTAHTIFDNKKINFKGSIRIKSDSIIWVSLTKLGGVELVRMVLTNDSVKFINKWDKEFYAGKLDDLKDFGGISVDYKTLEDLFIGKPFDFNKDDKYKSSNDNVYYLLSSKSKSKIRKVTQVTDNDSLLTLGMEMKDKKYDKVVSKESEDDLILKSYYLMPQSFLLTKQSINLIAQQQAIEIAYDDYELIDNLYIFALNQVIRIATLEKSSRLDIKYTTIKINEPMSFPFKISKKYAPIEKK